MLRVVDRPVNRADIQATVLDISEQSCVGKLCSLHLANMDVHERPDYFDKPYYKLYPSKHVLGKLRERESKDEIGNCMNISRSIISFMSSFRTELDFDSNSTNNCLFITN